MAPWHLAFILFSCLPVLSGAVDAAHDLTSRHDVVYVTDRPAKVEEATRGALRRAGFPEAPLFLTARKGDVGLDFIIDDRAINIDMVGAGFLVNAPWNQADQGYDRVRGLRDAASRL